MLGLFFYGHVIHGCSYNYALADVHWQKCRNYMSAGQYMFGVGYLYNILNYYIERFVFHKVKSDLAG